MISINSIIDFYPEYLRKQAILHKYMLKEQIMMMTLDYLSTTAYAKKMRFIGGTCLRFTKGIDRFSEDLDFDTRQMSAEEFMDMTGDVIRFLNNSGLDAVARDRHNAKLKAYRRNIIFPEFLYQSGLSGHRDERFLIKIECQDQEFNYQPQLKTIKGGFHFFTFPVAPDEVLCAMKLLAMFNRAKGRDFYDVLFLMPQTEPDFDILQYGLNISNMNMLKVRAAAFFSSIDLLHKMKDFEHLLFNKHNSKKILTIPAFFEGL
jgi:predicted nucleotidyltransferase component of viral defense system